jgi:pimeloyl-ACP methyl ester carboxylesterase
LVHAEPIGDVEKDLQAQMGQGEHVSYRSVSGITGESTEVSGSLFVPKGNPPQGGWPVVSLGHGFTGINTECALSGKADFMGYYGAIAGFLAAGYAVAMTDYQGLGGPGLHPFLEPRTAGFNVIDAVRALRTQFPGVSARWVAFGNSQGGQATWAANEINHWYGDGLDLLGSVALAPAANVSAVAQLSYAEKLTPSQLAVMPAIIVGAQRSYPDVPITGLLHGDGASHSELLAGCGHDADVARSKLTAADVKPASANDAAALTQSLRKMALPMEPASAPMEVLTGGADELILPNWVSQSVERACKLGDTIRYRILDGVGHDEIGPDDKTIAWVADRFAGKPAEGNCTGAS